MKNWKKTTDAIFGIDEKGRVLVILLLILVGDGSLMLLLFGSLIGSLTGAFLPDLSSVRHQFF